MLTKILLTALIIAAAYLFLRHKRAGVAARERQVPASGEGAGPLPGRAVRQLAGALLLIFLLGACAFFAYRWYDNRTLLDIRVINSATGEVVLYQAYKGDLEGRSFVTVYGQAVSIADSERMEIREQR